MNGQVRSCCSSTRLAALADLFPQQTLSLVPLRCFDDRKLYISSLPSTTLLFDWQDPSQADALDYLEALDVDLTSHQAFGDKLTVVWSTGAGTSKLRRASTSGELLPTNDDAPNQAVS